MILPSSDSGSTVADGASLGAVEAGAWVAGAAVAGASVAAPPLHAATKMAVAPNRVRRRRSDIRSSF
jgi:hypothetical protein